MARIKTKLIALVSVFVFAVFAGAGAVLADEVDIQKLLDKISALESKVSQLEGRVSMKEHPGPTKEVAPMQAPTGQGLVKSVEDIHLGGYLSTAYNLNTENPLADSNGVVAGPAAGTFAGAGNNTGIRAFDRDAHSVTTSGKLTLEKMVTDAGTAGFRTDLQFGRTAQILNSATVGDSPDNIFIEQAYVEYVAPIGNGVNIKAGRFVTLAGAEVIESKDNWNSSRSLLFNNAIPYTHNGVVAAYKINDMVDAKLGVANGWDSSIDNNQSKTLLTQVALHPMSGLDVTNTVFFGSEQTRAVGGLNVDDNLRGLWDVVVAWTPIKDNDRWKVLANWDYGWEEKASALSPSVSSGNAEWHGLALGTKYDVNDWLTLAGRWEYFADPDAARLGGINGLTRPTSTTFYEMTYTADIKLAKNLLTRLEYRYDQSSESVFDLGNPVDASGFVIGASQSQSTFGAELIYTF